MCLYELQVCMYITHIFASRHRQTCSRVMPSLSEWALKVKGTTLACACMSHKYVYYSYPNSEPEGHFSVPLSQVYVDSSGCSSREVSLYLLDDSYVSDSYYVSLQTDVYMGYAIQQLPQAGVKHTSMIPFCLFYLIHTDTSKPAPLQQLMCSIY